MKPGLVGHIEGRVVARSPDPPTVYLSNPDWAVDDGGPVLLWDRFGGEHKIELARREAEHWRRVADFDDAMHSHLIDLPEQALRLVIGVCQTTRPRSIQLWHSADGDRWRGPVELFGGADYHAGSTPWAIHDGILHVPFEVQQGKHWGSYCYGSVHADLRADLRRPGSWRLSQSRVPWSVFPGCEPCGALEGNLVVAPDGRFYNLLRIPAYSRLGRAEWDGRGWRWLGLIQGVHNQSKPEIFGDAASGRWFLLANGWPDRPTATQTHGLRNTLCLWEADEPDLSRWKLSRVIASDLEPRHAYSYAAGIIDPRDGGAWIADRHGDDETWNYHDTNCIAVRHVPDFLAWVDQPALVPYGHDKTAGGLWAKGNCQDGLLLSHLDGALYPLTIEATVRVDTLPGEIGALDLLGFATCDLVLLAGLQLVDEGRGPQIALSASGQRHRLPLPVAAGTTMRLALALRSPWEVEVVVDGESLLRCRTHCVSDPSLAGVIPRADRPAAQLGRVAYLEPPRLLAGDVACEAPELPAPWILVDGRGVSKTLPGEQPAPVDNLAADGPLVCGGHARFFDSWAGGLQPGARSAALWSPLEGVPEALTLAGFARVRENDAAWTVVLAALGERSAGNELRRDLPYLALLLSRDTAGAGPRLALAWSDGESKQMLVAPGAVSEWFAYALTAEPADDGLRVAVLAGEPGLAFGEALTATVPRGAVGEARHWLALVGQQGGELWAVGGQTACAAALTREQLDALCRAGFATKLDRQPARRPSCATDPAELAEPAAEPAPPEAEPAAEPPAEPELAPETPEGLDPQPDELTAPVDEAGIEAELAALKEQAAGRSAPAVSAETLAAWEAELAQPPPPPEPPTPPTPPDPPQEL